MSFHHSPRIVTDGLGLYLDASNPKSYPGSGDAWYDLSGNNFHMRLYGQASQSLASASNESFLKYFDLDGSSNSEGKCDGTVAGSTVCYPGNFVSGSDPRSVVSVFMVDDGVGSNSGGIYNYGMSGATGRHFSLMLISSYTTLKFQTWGAADHTFAYDTRAKWSMVTMVWNNTDEIGRTYANEGNLISEDGGPETLATDGDSNYPFTMAIPCGGCGTGRFGGKIVLFMFYTKALTPEECAQNYYALRSRWGG